MKISAKRTLRRLGPLTAIVIALCLVSQSAVRAADWPQWRGPTRDGVSAERVWPAVWKDSAPRVVWEARVGIGFSSFAVVGERAYTMGHVEGKDVVWCLDARTGETLWASRHAAALGDDLHEGGPGATPTVASGRVYTLNKWGLTLCLDAASGDVIWKRDLKREDGVAPNDWGLAGSPLLWEDLVILNAGSAGAGLSQETGATAWLSGKEKAGYASPLLFRPTAESMPAILIFAAKELVAVAPRTGKALWRQSFRTGYDNNNADPIIDGARILITSYDRGALCLDARAEKPAVVWDEHSIKTHMAPPVLVGEHLFGFSGHYGRSSDLRCVHLPTGQLRWRHRGLAAGSMLFAGGTLVILDGEGELVLAAPGTDAFEPLARAKVLEGRCWAPPALAGGRLYVRNSRGLARCIDVRTTDE